MEAALAFTRQDRFKALPGYQVMATHFHTSSVEPACDAEGSLDAKLPDLEAIKGAGINIFARSTAVGLGSDACAAIAFRAQFDYYEIARRNSDKNFLFMPNEESSAGNIGGHEDVLVLEAGVLGLQPSRQARRSSSSTPSTARSITSADRPT